MTRTTWLLALLLLGTNAAWLGVWLAEDRPSQADGLTGFEQEQTIATLQDEIAELRRAEPVLVGVSSGERAAADASKLVEGQGSAASAEAPSTEATPTQSASPEDAARKKAYAVALARAKDMLRKVMQVADPSLRQEGLDEIRQALAGNDAPLIEYTLSALYSLRDTEIDRGAFLGLVREHLQSEKGGIRRSALYALFAVDPEAADVRIALESAHDPDPVVRSHVAKLLGLYGGAQLDAAASDTILSLLADEERMVRRGTLRGLSGAQVNPALERKLIEIAAQAEDPAVRREALYHGLSPLRAKSRDVVDALFSHLDAGDQGLRARAHWGLKRGIPKAQQRYVASQYADRLGTFLSTKGRTEALQLIARYGDERLVPKLERFAENDLLDANMRALARKAAAYLAKKSAQR